MLMIRLIGALLIIGGIVYLARAAILRGRMSDPGADPPDTPAHTLEPRQGGFRFLGLKATWPGLVMVALGGLLLLLPLLLGQPPQ